MTKMSMNTETYKAIEAWIAEHGYSPTIKELAKALGLSSSSPAFYRVQKLLDAGLLVWPLAHGGKRRSRTMRLVSRYILRGKDAIAQSGVKR